MQSRPHIPKSPSGVERIISGGQTGADRAGLDVAIRHGIPHGGWCPKGRRAETGRVPAKYRLKETPRPTYIQRTEWNVRDSDGTAIFTIRPSGHHNELILPLGLPLSRARRRTAAPPRPGRRDFPGYNQIPGILPHQPAASSDALSEAPHQRGHPQG